jgi:hypothetical protein
MTRNGNSCTKISGCAEFIHIVEDNDIAQGNTSANRNRLALFIEFSSYFIFEPEWCQSMHFIGYLECDFVFLYIFFEIIDERSDTIFFGPCELGVSLVGR